MVSPFNRRYAWSCAGGGFVDLNGAMAEILWGLNCGLLILCDLRREEALKFVHWVRRQVRRGDILAGRHASKACEHSLEPVSVQIKAGNV